MTTTTLSKGQRKILQYLAIESTATVTGRTDNHHATQLVIGGYATCVDSDLDGTEAIYRITDAGLVHHHAIGRD